MKRCFVAFALPPETRETLTRVQSGLKRLPGRAAAKIRLVARNNLHVTLKFLGSTADEQVEPVVEALRRVAAESVRPRAVVQGVRAFPSRERPRVVLAAIGQGEVAVVQLAEAIETAVEPLGFSREDRPQVPHVTLARVERASPSGPLTTWIETATAEPLGAVADGQIILFESQLSPGGSVYTPLASLPLGSP